MDEEKSTPTAAHDATEAAGSLRFISSVMARTQERLGDFAAIGVWWGTGSFLALATHFLVCYFGYATTARLTALWVAHNVIGWSATLTIVGRSEATSATVRQSLGVWAVTNVALWVVIAATLWAEAIAGWAFWTMLQVVIGLALASTGIIEREKLAIGAGLLFIGSAPFILAFPKWAFLTSALLMGTVYGMFGLLAWMGWRKERHAS